MLYTIRRHRLELFTLAVGIFLLWLLWTARSSLPAFVIGLALAFVLDPGVTFIEKRGIPRWAGVLAMYALVGVLIWLLVTFAFRPIGEQLREFIGQLPELAATVETLQDSVNGWFEDLPLPPALREAIDESVTTGEQALGGLVNSIAAPFFSALLRTAGFIAGLLIIPIWLFFVLKDRGRLPYAVAAALPPAWREDGRNLLWVLGGVGGRWVRGQLLLGAAVAVATAIGLFVLSLVGFEELGRFALVLAIIAGILEWVPVIGPVLAAIPALLIALTIDPAAVIAVLILYIVIQQLENNLLVPKIMGDAIELHPAVMILALVVGGGLFGFWGAVLAAPVVAAGRDVYRYMFLRLGGHDADESYRFASGRAARAAAASVAVQHPDSGAEDERPRVNDRTATSASGEEAPVSEASDVRPHADRLQDSEPEHDRNE